MLKNNLGYPRIGDRRELKKASELFWAGKLSLDELVTAGKNIRLQNWKTQQEAGIDLIPSNDFSFYDQVLDMALTVGAIPDRYEPLKSTGELELYFAMARGYQKDGLDITAMKMTKWFDTNYHYIVPEFVKNQSFELYSTKIVDEFNEAKLQGIETKPVIIGPATFLLLGKEKEAGFHRIDLLKKLLPVYWCILKQLADAGAKWVQIDEPILATDLSGIELNAITEFYEKIALEAPELNILLANYFDCYGNNLETVLSLPVQALHLDLVRCPSQLQDILGSHNLSSDLKLSLGVVDGRNIWKNDFDKSLEFISRAKNQLGEERVMIASSCSLLHSPCDLELEQDEFKLSAEIKDWLAFARQKLDEIALLAHLSQNPEDNVLQAKLQDNQTSHARRQASTLIHNQAVKQRVADVSKSDIQRGLDFKQRKVLQQETLNLPHFPTTTIGSFPQTSEVRKARLQNKKGELSNSDYHDFLERHTALAIRWQEEIGLDVLVHGEFERNDMVEYFGEQLDGFAFTQFGWVQSYGSRCVKPPIIYGDVSRPNPMTLEWTKYAQSLTEKHVKGMLTGPVTILQWSFVRNDQPRSVTCNQIALAIRDEVVDLEAAGIKIIQVDEPAIREGLPLRRADWIDYLDWAIDAFKLATSGVEHSTQIHTHMCYSEFNDIIDSIARMDADVITIECSRSQMELLDAFAEFNYPNEIGPGVYDIHSPRVPSREEMVDLLTRAMKVIPEDQLWVNPDCGLKTRGWEETKKSLIEMVGAAQDLREKVSVYQ